MILKVWALCLALCLGTTAALCGAEATHFSGVGDVRKAIWTITPSPGSSNVTIRIQCSGFAAVQAGDGCSLRIPEQALSAKPGTPDVPRLARLLPGIKGTRAVLAIHGTDSTNLTNVLVAPAEGFRLVESESPKRQLRPYRQPDTDIYGRDEFWPVELGKVEEAWLGTQRVVRVECFPVQYNPLTKAIRFYRRLEGELRFEPCP